MTAITHMQAAIDNAAERQIEMVAKYGDSAGLASGFAETPAGKVGVSFVLAAGVTTFRAEHCRKVWSLNGKRISAEKLKAALSE